MKYLVHYLLLIALGAGLFLPFLGQLHLFDAQELIYAEAAREMVATGNFNEITLHYRAFPEEPPLFIRLQALSMQWLGVNEYAARLPGAIAGIFTLLIIFTIGTRFFDPRLGWFWVLAYIGSFLPHLMFKSAVPEPIGNLFIFLSLYYIMLLTRIGNFRRGSKIRHSLPAGIFLGLAFLTEGSFAVMVIVLCLIIYWFAERFYPIIKLKHLLTIFGSALLIGLAWFAYLTISKNPIFVKEFFSHQLIGLYRPAAGNTAPVFFHPMLLLLGCFPASLLIWSTFRTQIANTFEQRHFKQWMLILLVVIVLVTSIFRSPAAAYSSLAYFPITFLAAYFIYELMFMNRLKWRKYHNFLLLFFGFLIGIFLIAAPLISRKTDFVLQYTSNPYLRAAMQTNAGWAGWESIAGVFFIAIIIWAVIRLNNERKQSSGFSILLIGCAITVQAVCYLYLPKLEAYNQRGIIGFYKTLQNKNVYVHALGFESYAPAFYSNAPESDFDNQLLNKYIEENREGAGERILSKSEFNKLRQEWLLMGEIDKPAILIARMPQSDEYKKVHKLRGHGIIAGYEILSRIPER